MSAVFFIEVSIKKMQPTAYLKNVFTHLGLDHLEGDLNVLDVDFKTRNVHFT